MRVEGARAFVAAFGAALLSCTDRTRPRNLSRRPDGSQPWASCRAGYRGSDHHAPVPAEDRYARELPSPRDCAVPSNKHCAKSFRPF